MKTSELRRALSYYEDALGCIEPHQLDYFLKMNSPAHYQAKKHLEGGQAEWKYLKKYSDFAKYHNNHDFYYNAVRSVCQIEGLPTVKYAEFVGRGAGKGSLNSYRKIILDNNDLYFEKIYKSDSDDLKKIEFFYQNIFPHIGGKFKVPRLVLLRGHFGSVALFQWIDNFVPIDREKILDFYRFFREAVTVLKIPSDSRCEILVDFTRESMIQDGLKRSKEWLNLKKRADELKYIDMICAFLKLLPRKELIFNHGDINKANISENGIVIDFDRCGFYPAGYDLAFIASKQFFFEDLNAMEVYLQKDIKDFSLIEKLGFYFFAFLFYSRGVGVKASDDFLMELWEALCLKMREVGIEG